MLKITIIKCLSDNYSYLLKDENTNTVGIVDPSDFTTVDKEIDKKYKKLDYISYPYEWSFDQLKNAAIHHLDFHIFLLN